MADKSIDNYKVEMSSFVLGCGLLVVYGLTKLYGPILLLAQFFYIFVYLRWFNHVLDLLKSSILFRILFTSVCFILGFLPSIFYIVGEPQLSNISIAFGITMLIGTFYYICSPNKLREIGWSIKK